MLVRRIAAGTAAAALPGTVFVAGPAAAKGKGETNLTLSKGLVQGMDAAGVGIKAIRGAGLSKSGVVSFRVTSVDGKVITHKGALLFSSSEGFVTLQNIALNYKTGKASALVEAPAATAGIQIVDVLTFTGGKDKINQNGIWKNVKVALATRPLWATPPCSSQGSWAFRSVPLPRA